jgi:hypothetical protein
MQIMDTDVDISEAEVVQMRTAIEGELDDNGRDLVARLVLAMEPQMAMRSAGEVVFDLATIQKRTLLAVRSYLRARGCLRVKITAEW